MDSETLAPAVVSETLGAPVGLVVSEDDRGSGSGRRAAEVDQGISGRGPWNPSCDGYQLDPAVEAFEAAVVEAEADRVRIPSR